MRHSYMKILLLIIVLLLGINNSTDAMMSTDSVKVSNTVSIFYRWYINAIKDRAYDEFKPKFSENKHGMTTLEYNKYITNLRFYKFSDNLINREIASYDQCIDSLSKVKYLDFQKTKFIDLNEYEQCGCDFGNYYRWIGGQEICDGILIRKTEFSSKDECIVTIEKYDLNEEGKYFFWSYFVTIRLEKIGDTWRIDNIEL